MDDNKCMCCGARINVAHGKLCFKCYDKRERVHELYLTCQLVRKYFGMPYDKKLDEERWKYQG